MMCKCCSSLCICRFFKSSLRRACTWSMRASISCNLASPSIRASKARCWFCTLMVSTFARKMADLSLDNCAFSSWNLSIRSSSASIWRACASCCACVSSPRFANCLEFFWNLSSSLVCASFPTFWKCFSEAALLCWRTINFSCSFRSFSSCSSLSRTNELCCRSWPLRSPSKRLASFSNIDSSIDRNWPLCTPGTSPFFAS
mmetsp:Transcript_76384/g.151083  ORF Transcript_76384/g.151083 Transcript_76384/m.151083 type:complete len:201 (+) Transcript_76384:807-1409(+)